MNKNTSLELSKKLAKGGCKLESKYWHIPQRSGASVLGKYPYSKENCYPSYDLLWDVCIKYADKFFAASYATPTLEIFALLSFNKKQEAETYFWEHTVFNPKNKEGKDG